MGDRVNTALNKILAATEQQLDILLDGLARPGLDQTQARRHAFELVLKAMAAEARGLSAESELADPDRQALQGFLKKAEAFDRGSVDVHSHIIELSEDWACKDCGADVAAEAAVSGVRAETYQVELICQACGERSPLAGKGYKRFQKIFGALIAPTWNPRANGFIWNES